MPFDTEEFLNSGGSRTITNPDEVRQVVNNLIDSGGSQTVTPSNNSNTANTSHTISGGVSRNNPLNFPAPNNPVTEALVNAAPTQEEIRKRTLQDIGGGVRIQTISPEHKSVTVSTEFQETPVFTPKRVLYSADRNYKPEKEGDVIIYTDQRGKLTGESSNPIYEASLSNVKGSYVDREALSYAILSNPIVSTSATPSVKKERIKPSTVTEENFVKGTQPNNDKLSEYLKNTSSLPLSSGTGIYNPKTKEYEPQRLYFNPENKSDLSFIDSGMNVLGNAPSYAPMLARNLAKNLHIGDIKAEHVVVAEKKYYPTGTSAFDTSSNQFFVPESKLNKVKNVEYEAKGLNIAPEIIGFGVGAAQYAFPITAAPLITAGGIAGTYHLVKGFKEDNKSLILRGAIEAAPAVIYGEVKGFRYLTEPINNPVEFYSAPNNERINLIRDGKQTIGLSVSNGEQTRMYIQTQAELPTAIVPKTTRLRNLFGLQPTSYSEITPVFNFQTGATKAISVEASNNLFTSRAETTFPASEYDLGSSVTRTRAITSEIKPEEFVKLDKVTQGFLKDLSNQYGYNMFVSDASGENPVRFFRYGQSSEITGKPSDVGVIAIEPVTSFKTPAGVTVTSGDLTPVAYKVRVASLSSQEGVPTDFSRLFIRNQFIPPVDESGFSVISGGQTKTNLFSSLSTEQVAKAVATIPPSQRADFSLPLPPSTAKTSLELAPAIVGGLGQDKSFFNAQGNINSNQDFNQGNLKVTKDEFTTKGLTANKLTFIDLSKFKTNVKPIENTNLGSGTSQSPSIDTNQIQNPIQDVTPIQIQQPISRQTQVQFTAQESLSRSRFPNGFGRNNNPIFVPKPKVPKLTKGLLSRVKQAYDVVVFKKGKEIKIAGGLPKGLAERAGVKNVMSNLRASFKLKPKGTTSQEDISYKIPETFRLSKYDSNRFVQKKNTRFGQRAETREAQFFRKVKKGKIKWF